MLATRLRRDGVAVTGLSSLPRPDGWDGDWVRLPRDDDGDPRDVSAHGHLHWAPLLHDGTRSRAAALSAWLETARPDLLVVDVSVEVLLLARLHGIPAVGVVLPGRRDDRAHLLGFGVAEALVGFWPRAAHDMTPGLPDDLRERLVPVGALSRHPVRDGAGAMRPRQPVVRSPCCSGRVATTSARTTYASRRPPPPTGDWHVLGADRSTWVADPSAVLAGADVVVTHAGQNALAETAAARRPAVVLPQLDPTTSSRPPAPCWPTAGRPSSRPAWPAAGEWAGVLDRAAALDPRRWAEWCDGRAADRFADVVLETRARVVDGTAR